MLAYEKSLKIVEKYELSLPYFFFFQNQEFRWDGVFSLCNIRTILHFVLGKLLRVCFKNNNDDQLWLI